MNAVPISVRNLPRFTAADKPDFLPDIPVGTYLRYWLSTDEEQITTPARAYGRRTSESLNMQIPRAAIEHHLVWENVASPPWQAMQDCLNAINNVAFLGVVPFQLLFSAVHAEPTYAGDTPLAAASTWRIHYVFRRCPKSWTGAQHNWNYAWVETYGFKSISDPVEGGPFYRNVNFAALLAEEA
jgi:hypothetical protein